jgi:hypothetical protein
LDCARAGRVKHGCGGPIAGRLVVGFQAKSWTAAIILVRDGGDWSAQSRTAAAFGRLIYGHLEGLRTRDFDYPAYRAYVAGAAICIVRIVAPSKSPSANAVGCGRNMTQTTAKESAQGDRGGRRQYDGKAVSTPLSDFNSFRQALWWGWWRVRDWRSDFQLPRSHVFGRAASHQWAQRGWTTARIS